MIHRLHVQRVAGQRRLRMASALMATLALIAGCATHSSTNPDAVPVTFEDIHYFLTDHKAAGAFFQTHFGARRMAHPGRPVHFIDFWQLRPGEVPLTLSPMGPFEGSPVSSFWTGRDRVPPSPDNAPIYGVYSVGVATPSLDSAMARMTANGVAPAATTHPLPSEPHTPTQTIVGPDYTLFQIVERPDMRPGYAGFGIDHVRLMVKDKAATQRFFETLYFGKTEWSDEHSVVMTVIDVQIILSEPEALGIDRATIEPTDRPGKLR